MIAAAYKDFDNKISHTCLLTLEYEYEYIEYNKPGAWPLKTVAPIWAAFPNAPNHGISKLQMKQQRAS